MSLKITIFFLNWKNVTDLDMYEISGYIGELEDGKYNIFHI